MQFLEGTKTATLLLTVIDDQVSIRLFDSEYRYAALQEVALSATPRPSFCRSVMLNEAKTSRPRRLRPRPSFEAEAQADAEARATRPRPRPRLRTGL